MALAVDGPDVAAPTTSSPPAVRARPNAVLVAIGLGAVACLALWWQNTPAVQGLGDWLTNAGRITGLLAGYWWQVLFPALAIASLVVAITLIADSIEQVLAS